MVNNPPAPNDIDLLLDPPHTVDTGAACSACMKVCNDLSRCSACLHAWYCNQDCQRQVYKQHKPFCKVLKKFSQLSADLPERSQPKSAKDFYIQRLNAREYLSRLIGRQLTRAEARSIINEAKCSVCFKTREQVAPSKLVCCSACNWGWACEEHATKYHGKPHRDVCETYRLMNSCERWVHDWCKNTGRLPSFRPDGLKSSYTGLPVEGWDVYSKWRPLPHLDPMMLAVFSNRLSQPLTVMLALQTLYGHEELQTLRDITIHVIGASAYEAPADSVWEEILHWLPDARTLHVDFIGPEIATIIVDEEDGLVMPKSVCNKCGDKDRSRSYAYHMCTYHDFLKRQESRSDKLQATLSIAFNSGIHQKEDDGVNGGIASWEPSLKALIRNGTPVAFTSYTKDESHDDMKLWTDLGGRVFSSAAKNPYQALQPIMEPSAVDEFYYHSYYWFTGKGSAKAT